MSESIKKRVGASHLGQMSKSELKKLLDATLTDLTALKSTVNNVVTDLGKVQTVTNNLASAVNNIKTNCSNATVNVNSQTLTATAPSDLTLTS